MSQEPSVVSQPMFLGPGEGRRVQIRDTKTTTFKITGAATDGRFELFEHRMAPGASGASPHFHKEMIEMFYVVQGEVEFVLGDDKRVGTPGTFLFVPEYVPHGFDNVGQTDAVILIMFCPANGREKYFEGLGELTKDGRSPSLGELVELMERFDQYLV